MATLRQIVYNLRNILGGGSVTDESVPSYQQLVFVVNTWRTTLLRRDLDRNNYFSPDFTQDLGCLDLIVVDPAECPCFETDCLVLRTELKVPKFIRLTYRPAIAYFGAITKMHRFDIILPEAAEYLQYKKYTSKEPRGFYLNNYIYIPNNDELGAINLRGALVDPRDAKRFTCNNEPCYTDNSDYPMSDDMITQLNSAALKGELRDLIKEAQDKINNASDDVKEER